MSRKSRNDSYKDYEIVKESEVDYEETPTFSTTEVVEEKEIKTENNVLEEKKEYKVILVDKYSIMLEDENGNGIVKYGSFDAKVGETIEI